ncbi:MAG: class I SAM-dependent methyltransferase [Caldisericia bacterium]|jgi:SAM-dependent methyltransferase|nr:class I SAM-dependent methyltransferase [Caldisericia bacterium]
MKEWFLDFFDENYLTLYLKKQREELTLKQVNFIINSLSLKKGMKILDLGCGIGRHIIELGKRGFFGVGVDFNEKYIDIANKLKEGLQNVNFIKMDMREISFLEEFDAVLSMWTSFGYFSDEENLSLLKKINQSLKCGGKFLLDIENIFYMLKNLPKERWEREGDFYILERNELNYKISRLKTERVIIKEGTIKTYTRIYRIFTLKEIEHYLNKSYFKILNIYGGYDGEEYSNQSKRLIVISEKL